MNKFQISGFMPPKSLVHCESRVRHPRRPAAERPFLQIPVPPPRDIDGINVTQKQKNPQDSQRGVAIIGGEKKPFGVVDFTV